jgi:hypothetical protein
LTEDSLTFWRSVVPTQFPVPSLFIFIFENDWSTPVCLLDPYPPVLSLPKIENRITLGLLLGGVSYVKEGKDKGQNNILL